MAKCPYSKGVINPTFVRLYAHLVGEAYTNTKGETSYKCKFSPREYAEFVETHRQSINYKVSPYLEVPCGKCNICMSNRKQDWIYRLKQELDSSQGAMFITLTYNDLYLPHRDKEGNIHRLGDEIIFNEDAYPSLYKYDFQLFMKRLRKSAEPIKLRFFAVGEYGGKFKRPHYHVLLFGLPYQLTDQYDPLKVIQDTWPYGQVDIGEVNGQSINYVVSYMDLKKFAPHEYAEPQFCLMSRRPGIGSQILKNQQFKKFFTEHRLLDNTAMVAHDGVMMPLPRFFKAKLYTDNQRLAKQQYDYANPLNVDAIDANDQRQKVRNAKQKDKLLSERAFRKKIHA